MNGKSKRRGRRPAGPRRRLPRAEFPRWGRQPPDRCDPAKLVQSGARYRANSG